MAKQYWVGEFHVDLSRNQISQPGQSQTLPPKALLVLTQLAENPGQVLSYDELLDRVWPNSVVTPNTLQRSIAQLRKALGENSKAQGIIKTHAKQGYSLECHVSWSHETGSASGAQFNTHSSPPAGELISPAFPLTEAPLTDESEGETRSENKPETATQKVTQAQQASATEGGKQLKPYYGIAAIVVGLILMVGLLMFQQQDSSFQFSDFHYLTATDDKEYGATYSPDGKYIVFHRYYDKLCVNNLWAKNASTQEEIRLTKVEGTYAGHSLSADGQELVFIKEEDCTKPINSSTCYRLMSLDFNQALVQQQTPIELMQCQDSAIKQPVWVGDDSIVMLQKQTQQWRLIRYSIEDKTSSVFYQMENGTITNFSYSADRQVIGVTGIKEDGSQVIEMLTLEGTLLSSHRIQLPDDAPRHMFVFAEMVPRTDKLIFAYGVKLYTLSEQGQVSEVDYSFNTNIGRPYFHPQQQRVLLIKGRYDSDVARLPLPVPKEAQINPASASAVHNGAGNDASHGTQDNPGTVSTVTKATVFERSIGSEDYASFQPGSESIAFASERTGTEQVWVATSTGTTMLSQFPKGSYISNLAWAADGGSVLVLVNLELHQLYLDGRIKVIDFPHPTLQLYHWDSEGQQVVANIMQSGVRKFVEIDLQSLAFETLNHKNIQWAAKTGDGRLIFMDDMQRFWQKGGIEDQRIEALTGQGSFKRFVLKNEQIYGINKQDQLWSYHLSSGQFTLLGVVPEGIDYLTDIKNNQLLVTVLIAAKKEVIELLPKE